jgi:hypothetical protein
MWNLGKKKAEVAVAIEYVAPYWVVLIRNPGQKNWNALRSKTRKVNVQNEFGEIVKTYNAIETFTSKQEAQGWIDEHLKEATTVMRKDSEIEKFLLKAKSPVSVEVLA